MTYRDSATAKSFSEEAKVVDKLKSRRPLTFPAADRRVVYRWLVGLLVGAAAFGVMPQGPWYREVLAAVLVMASNDILHSRL